MLARVWPCSVFATHFLVPLRHGRFAGKFHPALLIDAEASEPDLITQLDDIFGLLDAEIGQLADVAQPILAREKLNETAKFLNRDDLAAVNFPDLGFGSHAFDFASGDFHAFGAGRIDVNRAVVLNVDLAAGLFDDAFDVLAARADEGTDLLRVNLHGDDARGVLAQFFAGLSDGFGHFAQDKQTGHASLFPCFGHDVVRQSAQFEIQLKAGDAASGAGDLAVHVTERVFPADDVGEELMTGDGVAVIGLGANAAAHA